MMSCQLHICAYNPRGSRKSELVNGKNQMGRVGYVYINTFNSDHAKTHGSRLNGNSHQCSEALFVYRPNGHSMGDIDNFTLTIFTSPVNFLVFISV